MADETTPTPEQIAAAQESADALVASSVADLVVLIEGADLLTLQLALAAEQAKGDGARKGAVAALQAAIDGHPETAAADAAAADAPVEPGTASNDPVEPATEAPAHVAAPEPAIVAPDALEAPVAAAGEITVTIGADVSEPVIVPATDAAPATASVTVQPTVDGEPHGDPITITATADPDPEPNATTDPTFGATITTVADLEDEPSDPNAISDSPPRPHQSLVDQLDMRWNELKDFIRVLDGEVEGVLGEVLTFVRAKL